MVFVFLWLISHSIILSSSIHVIANGKMAFFLMAESHSIVWYLCVRVCVCICHIFFIHSSIDGHLPRCFLQWFPEHPKPHPLCI